MESNNPNNRQTPARRGRGGGRANRGRKNYASEGDALTEMPTPASFPATPMKSNNGSPAPGSQPANAKSTTKKNNRKSRPNNVSTSPGPAQSNQRTPPPSASATVYTAAFASSSSFHSPAPGTLPRPSFSKFNRSQSCATSTEATFMRVRSESAAVPQVKEPSPPASDAESPSRPVLKTEHEASPLDFLFNAHRAEKEKLQRANSANNNAGFDGPFSAPPGSRNPSSPGVQDDPIPIKLPVRPAQRGVSDNTGVLGSASRRDVFALPIHERIQAARPAEYGSRQSPAQRGQAQPPHTGQLATPPRLDRSEEMKRLLGISTPNPKPEPAPMPKHTSSPVTSSLSDASPSQVHLRGSDLSNGGMDHRKMLAEDALRKALGLNFPFSMGRGLDGNDSHSPSANRFQEHA